MSLQIMITEGSKGPGDKRVMVRAPHWVAPKFSDIMKILDAWFQNEDILYPPAQGYKGREMLLDLIFAVYERQGTGKELDEIFKEFYL